jgi:ankyrin repeat protein
MTDKPFPKPAAKQSFVPRYEIQNQFHLPEGNENENINNQLFLTFADGNYLKIKDFINKFHSLVNIQDENDNNVLHKIIENETLSENEKTELINLAISKNINVSESNTYNITPLHLACQFQYKSIINLLLDNGADINKQDNNGFTPIHYAVMGLSIDCEIVDSYKRTKKIIKKGDKIEKIDNNLKELMNDINQYFVGEEYDGDDVVRTNLNHLETYLKKFKAIFPDRHKKLSEDLRTIVSEIISNPSLSSEDKYNSLLKKIITERDSLMKEFNNIIETDAAVDLKIQAMKSGWSPDDDENDKNNIIMKKYDADDMINKIEEKVKDLKLDNQRKISLVIDKNNKDIKSINDYYNKISQNIGNLYYYLDSFDAIGFGGNIIQNTINLISIFKNRNNIIRPEININNIIGVLNNNVIRFINPNDPNDQPENIDITSEIKKNTNLYYTYSDVLIIIDHIKKKYREDDFEDQLDIFENIAGFGLENIDDTNNIITYYNKLKKKIKDENLEDERYPNSIDKMERYIDLFIYPINNIIFGDNRNIYFFSELKFYLYRIELIKRNISVIINDINTNLQNQNNYNEIFNEKLSNLITNLINIGIILKIINKLIENYKIIIGELDNNILKIFDNINNDINDQHNAHDNMFIDILRTNTYIIKKDIQKLMSELKNNNESFFSVNDIYKKSVYPIIEWMKNVIKYMEQKSSLEIFKKYHNDANVNNVNIGQINNIIGYKFFNENSEIPDTLDKFIEDFTENFDQYPRMKKKLFEKYIPKISLNYLEVFYRNIVGAPLGLPAPAAIGGGKIKSKKHKKIIKGGAITTHLTEGYLVEQIDRQNYVDNNIVVDLSKFGNIQIEESEEFLKSELKYPIIFSSEFARYHVGMVKYYILTKRLKKIYDLINTPQPNVQNLQPLEKRIYENIAEFEKSIEKFNLNGHGAILVILGNYMKNLVDKLIYDLTFVSSNMAILEEIKIMNITRFYKEISDLLQTHGSIQDVVLMKKISGYNVSLDKIYKNMFSSGLITNNINNITKKLGNMTQGNINEPVKNKYEGKVHKIMNSNYSQLKSWKEACYVIDYDVLEVLFKNKYLDVNIGDRTNQSAIFRAIEMKNIEAVNKLIKFGASVKQRDKNGDTALKFALKSYKKTIDKKYVNIYDICDKVTEDTFDEYKRKYNNNLPVNTNIIFKMALHMLNHNFLLSAGIYRGEWKFESFKELQESLINSGFDFNSALPLLDIPLTIDDFSQMNVYNLKLKESSENISEIGKRKNEMDLELSSLRGEETYINRKQQPLSPYDAARLQNVRNEINRINGEIQKLNNDLNQSNNDKTQLENRAKQLFDNYKTIFDRNKGLPIFNSVEKMYDYVFINVINHDHINEITNEKYNHKINYMAYSNMWRKYLDNAKNNIDHTSFMEMLNVYQDTILSEQDTNVKEKMDKCKPIFEFYNKVVYPNIKDYIELPKDLESTNKFLDVIINIIIHIVKRTVIVSFYYEILANIQAYLEESFKISGGKIDSTMIVAFLDSILKGESKLPDYIFRVLPKKLVKKTLNIYKNEDEYDDLDKDETTTIDDLFNNVVNIIASNTTIAIENDSLLISNLKEKTILRHKEYITIMIEKMYMLMNNYLLYLYDQSRDINILLSINK